MTSLRIFALVSFLLLGGWMLIFKAYDLATHSATLSGVCLKITGHSGFGFFDFFLDCASGFLAAVIGVAFLGLLGVIVIVVFLILIVMVISPKGFFYHKTSK